MNTKTRWQIRRERGRGRKLFWGIVLVFAIVSLVSVAHGFGRERGRSHFGGGSTHGATFENPAELREGLSRALHYLEVTDEQEAAVKTLVDELSPELVALADGKNAIRDRLVAALSAETVNPADFAAARVEGTAIAERAVELTIDATLRLAQILTPEQRAELVEHWSKR